MSDTEKTEVSIEEAHEKPHLIDPTTPSALPLILNALISPGLDTETEFPVEGPIWETARTLAREFPVDLARENHVMAAQALANAMAARVENRILKTHMDSLARSTVQSHNYSR